MNKSVQHKIYFIGIGGIGMSALARYFMEMRYEVYGYDKTSTVLTERLVSEGAKITYSDSVSAIDKNVISETELTVIYTPAIPSDNNIYNYFINKGLHLYKRSDILGLITKDTNSICVAGTHGKTTISTMAAYFLHAAGVACSGFLGGISVNTNSNLILDRNTNLTVIEADEFDRTFLKLYPNTVILSSTDADHLDIYGSKSGVVEGFQAFVDLIPEDGVLFANQGVSLRPSNKAVKFFTYGLENINNCYAKNLELVNGFYRFDLVTPFGVVDDIKLGVPGILNVENSVGALSAALFNGATADGLRKAAKQFKGIKRRFEVHSVSTEKIYIDDYAHHPSEISKTLNAISTLYPTDKVAVAFQPHLFSRTNDFADGFAEELQKADEVYLMDIYPARELPMPGVDSEMVIRKMTKGNAKLVQRNQVAESLVNSDCRIIVTMGAGDIDLQVKEVVEQLKQKELV